MALPPLQESSELCSIWIVIECTMRHWVETLSEMANMPQSDVLSDQLRGQIQDCCRHVSANADLPRIDDSFFWEIVMSAENQWLVFEEHLDPLLWLVTSAAGSQRGGLIATFVNKASLTPEFPRVAVGLAKQHFTSELVRRSGHFCVHLLGIEQAGFVEHFGIKTGHNVDKFDGILFHEGSTGAPILSECLAWMECRVETSLDIGDREIYVGEAIESGVLRAGDPLSVRKLDQLLTQEVRSRLEELLQRDSGRDAQLIRDMRRAQASHRQS